MTPPRRAAAAASNFIRRVDLIAAGMLAVGVLVIVKVAGKSLFRQDANWDLLNYHGYVPASLLDGTWFKDVHPAGQASYLTPYQDLMLWPVISSLPAPIATGAIMALQLSIAIPVGLILQLVVPGLSRARAIAIGFMGISGAMVITELGRTEGDVPPALLVAWGLYLLLSLMSDDASHPGRRATLAGILVGAAVGIKLTTAIVAPGLAAVLLALVLYRRSRYALIFAAVAPVTALLVYAPWAIVLQTQGGSPLFPLYNAIFKAPRYPAENIQDTRFNVTHIRDLIMLPVRLADGSATTSEIPFKDPRWLVTIVAAAVGVALAVLRCLLTRRWRLRDWRDQLAGYALIAFWGVSFFVWAYQFGIQRYATVLEVLALPIIGAAAYLAMPKLPGPVALLGLAVVVAMLALNTKPADFGSRPMTWSPIFPSETIQPLTRYDAVVTGSAPLAYLGAVTRAAPGAQNQIWVGTPFDEADRAVTVKALNGRSVGIVFYPDQIESARGAAASLGFQLTDDCATFTNPLSSEFIGSVAEVCRAAPAT